VFRWWCDHADGRNDDQGPHSPWVLDSTKIVF
jgi:hypothetical protein